MSVSAEFSDCSSGSDAAATADAVVPMAAVAAGTPSRVRAVGAVQRRKGSEWEILGNLEHGTSYAVKPRRYEGFMSKKRKWPLKGWHKR